MYYSQFGEDEYLSKFFPNNYIGTCIDVGAYDGITCSNTYYFEKNNWFCLCIEPVPDSFNTCNIYRKNTINYCVSNYDKEDIDFYVVTVNNTNKSAISSLNLDERLIYNHKDIINNIDKIKVKVKSLNTILNECNFSKNIDFISIDTENTEIDVLKGINFNVYNINFLIVENNFNENIIETYLIEQKFTKINRLGVNDFYVSNKYLDFKINNCYEIVNVNYINNKNNNENNITNIFKLLTKRYILSNYTEKIINCDELFDNTFSNDERKLHIKIKNNNNNEIINFISDYKINFYDLFKNIEYNYNSNININFNSNTNTNTKNLIEVSIGEIVDKYSILELKEKYISNISKIIDIINEKNILETYVNTIKTTFFYKLLLFINEQIWLDTNIIKELNINDNIYLFAEVSNKIFENNQRRFRIKNYFNFIYSSHIKEHKSYENINCYINISDEIEIYNKIAEINYLCISYDYIYFSKNYKNIINKLFKNPNIKFTDNNISNLKLIINLYSFTLEDKIRKIFEFNTIKYISGGKFGDFLNQLSVICENYYETGQKGELYIDNIGDIFPNGLINTYNDTYNTIISQNFIEKYEIYNNENIDVNLSSWRNNIDGSLKYNWFQIYQNNYNIEWAKHKWLSSLIDNKWKNKIIINITPYRFLSYDALNKLYNIINIRLNDCIFISNEKEHYDFFCNNTNLKIDYYKPNNFDETLIIINSCDICFLGFSSIAVIANALHKPHYLIGYNSGIDYNYNNLKNIIPHVLDIFI